MDPWLTPQQAADHLSLSLATIYRRVAEGEIPFHRVGRLLRFRRSELDAMVTGEWEPECKPDPAA